MKKRILSACVVALGVVGCTESQPKSLPVVPPVAALPPEVASQPVEVDFGLDAGMVVYGQPVAALDKVGLPHEHRVGTDHLSRARELREQGDVAGALAEARRAVFDNPTDEESLSFTATVARIGGKKELAAEALGRLGAVRSDDAVPMIQQARVLLAMGDQHGAVEAGKEGIIRDPNNAEGFQVVGRAYLSQGHLASAITMFEKAVEVEPDHGYALNNLGFAYLRSSQNEKALDVLSKAAQLLPHVAYVHNNLGVAMERAGRVEEAKIAYDRSMSLSPKYVKAAINAQRVAQAPSMVEPSAGEDGLMPELEVPEE